MVWEIKQLLFVSELSHHLKQELMSKHIIFRASETFFCMNHFLVYCLKIKTYLEAIIYKLLLENMDGYYIKI